jgi:hypothetical protein
MDKARLFLDHIARYIVTLKIILETLYPDGPSASAVLSRLMRDDLIQRVSNGLDGNYAYYQLTTKGAKLCNVPQNRARPKEAKGLALDLGALWFSGMGDRRGKRLTVDELKTLFGAPKGGNIVHIAQDGEDEETTVYRIFAPSSTSLLRTFLPTLKKTAFDVMSDEKILKWVERGTYALAVLVHSEGRRDDLTDLIRNEEFPDIRIHLDVVPTPSNLRQFLSPDKEAD